MSDKLPCVSICIPTYNGEKFLRSCLESVSAQTFGDIEILIVDDASSDATSDIARDFVIGEERARLIINEHNLGLVGNWNQCVSLARGEWIKFVFQDDLIAPSCVQRLYEAAVDHVLLVACERGFVFDEYIEAPVRKVYLEHQRLLRGLFAESAGFLSASAIQTFALEQFGINPLGEPTALLVRRAAFTRYGLFNPVFVSSCDLEFWLRVAVNSGAAVVQEELAMFRVHGSSTSAENLSQRYYRAMSLDNLILLTEYVHSTHFGPLRSRAKQVGVDLRVKLRDKKHEARAIAEWASEPPDFDKSPLRELESVSCAYPTLRVDGPSHLLWRIRRRFRGAQARSG